MVAELAGHTYTARGGRPHREKGVYSFDEHEACSKRPDC